MFRKGLLGYLPANILQGIVGFLALSVFTRLLSPDDYGRYALAFGVSSLAQTLFFTWIEAAMARFYVPESRIDKTAPELYGTVYRLFFIACLVFGAAVAFGMTVWITPDDNSKALKAAIGLGLAAVIFRTLLKLVQEQRRAEGRVAAASLVDMIQTAGGFLIGVGLAYSGLGGGSVVLASGIVAALVLPFVAREDWGRALKGHFNREKAMQFAHYGLPVSASLILTLALYTADRFLITHYLTEGDAGAYHAGFSLASRILDVLFIWFGAASGPALVHALETGGHNALKDMARQQIKTMALILFPAVGGLIMVAPALSQILIGEALQERALSVTPMIALGALFSGFTTYYFLQAFTLAKNTRLLIVAMSVPALSNIALNILLILKFGLIGAGYASAISFGLGLLTAQLLGLKSLSLPLCLPELSLMAVATAIMMAAIAYLPAWGGVTELALKSLVGAIIYTIFAIFFNFNGVRTILERVYQRFSRKVAS